MRSMKSGVEKSNVRGRRGMLFGGLSALFCFLLLLVYDKYKVVLIPA